MRCAMIQRKAAGGDILASKLDIAIVENCAVYLTWTRLALSSHYINDLEINLHLVGDRLEVWKPYYFASMIATRA